MIFVYDFCVNWGLCGVIVAYGWRVVWLSGEVVLEWRGCHVVHCCET